jgi:putative FmdB family regulatory protein
MPTYEYECTACGYEFEKFHSIKAAPIKKCPKCGKLKVKRLIGLGAGLIFKGSGFYITDYRSDAYNKSAKADSAPTTTGDAKPSGDTAAPTKTETKAETKSESKSEPKTESKPEPKTEPKPAEKKESKRK